MGTFFCLLKGDWEKGLPMLAKGSDAALKKLAEQELAKPAEAPKESWLGDERPPHKVEITKGFYLGKHEVTKGQFAAFVAATGYKTDAEQRGTSWGRPPEGGWRAISGMNWKNPNFKQTDDHPVTSVSWNDAVAFCKWLAEKTKKGVRLPTEAEWEYACRAGTSSWSWGTMDGTA